MVRLTSGSLGYLFWMSHTKKYPKYKRTTWALCGGFLRLFFKISFAFTTQLRGRYIDGPTAPCSHTYVTSPIINITHQNGTFVTKNEPTLTHCSQPKSTFYVRVHSLCCTCYEFGQIYNDI